MQSVTSCAVGTMIPAFLGFSWGPFSGRRECTAMRSALVKVRKGLRFSSRARVWGIAQNHVACTSHGPSVRTPAV